MYGTRTIPAVYGEETANTLMWVIDAASFGYIVLLTAIGVAPLYAVALGVFPLYSLFYRHLSGSSNQDVMRDLVADGEYLLSGPVVFLLGRL